MSGGHPSGPWPVERWGRDRLGDLAAVCAAALPDEHLLAEDLEAACLDDPPADADAGRVGPSLTLGVGDGDRPLGAAGLAIRRHGDLTTAHVQVLAVDPSVRRRGIGRALLAAAEDVARGHGAAIVQFGAAAPFYLFTGVDSRWTDALCFAERSGYTISGVELDLSCPTRPAPVEAPEGVTVDAVRSAADVEDLRAFAARCYPQWGPELLRGAEAGTAVVARGPDGGTVGGAAHSVNRLGVIGPMGVDPDHHGGGVGTAMVHALLGDLAVAGLERAEIAWVSTVRFYALACGATVLRSSLQVNRWL